MKKKLFEHVLKSAVEVSELFKQTKYVRMIFECRTGKTATALRALKLAGYNNCLFVTKASDTLKAVERDYYEFRSNLVSNCDFISYESLHKIPTDNDYDCMIVDECHMIDSMPKATPSKRAKALIRIGVNLPQIHLSATPAPEGDGQIYRQLQVCKYAPLHGMKFKEWVERYINVKMKRTSAGFDTPDYRVHKNNGIKEALNGYEIHKKQIDAGFHQTKLEETFFRVRMSDKMNMITKRFAKDKIVIIDGLKVIGRNITSERMKMHQFCGGVVIAEDKFKKPVNLILDYSKALSIFKETKQFDKVVIIYKFTAELELLENFFKTQLTTDLDAFKGDSKIKYYAGQIQSTSMGIDLSIADVMVMYNIDHSAVTYQQVLERLKHTNRDKIVRIYYFTTENGIDNQVLVRVRKKGDYTASHYRRDINKLFGA